MRHDSCLARYTGTRRNPFTTERTNLGEKKVGRSERNRTRYVLTGEALCVTSQSKLLGDFTGFAWHSHIFRRASTFITSCLMTSFPETFVLNSRDIRSGDATEKRTARRYSSSSFSFLRRVPYSELVIPPGIPFNVSSSDRKDSSGARAAPESAVHFRRLNSAAAPTDKRP